MRKQTDYDLSGSLLLSSEYWDCECDDKYIHPNGSDHCPRCGAERDGSPDSRQEEVDDGTHFADDDVKAQGPISYTVTITETLQRVVTVVAGNRNEAEQTVSDDYRASKYVLTADDFVGVEFDAALKEN